MSETKKKTSMGLATKILIAMVVGAALGYVFKDSYATWGAVTGPIGTIFIRLLKMTIMPLVFFSIVGGVASVADLQRLKKLAVLSCAIGLLLLVWQQLPVSFGPTSLNRV